MLRGTSQSRKAKTSSGPALQTNFIPMTKLFFSLALGLAVIGLTACSTMPKRHDLQPVPHVDLPRFMGDWYVIANIPYFAERGCVGSVETYKLLPNGDVDTTFTAKKPDFDGKDVKVRTLGIVKNKETNAEWVVQPFWPVRVAYVVIDLDPDYQFAVIGHPSRNYAWILARSPVIDDATYAAILARMAEQGYDSGKLEKVPQLADAPVFPVPQ